MRKKPAHSITVEQRQAGQDRLRELRQDPAAHIDWSGMAPERVAAIKSRLPHVPPRYLPVYVEAVGGTSRSAAIKSACLDCCGWDLSSVRECSALACPLWLHRPYQGSSGAEDEHCTP